MPAEAVADIAAEEAVADIAAEEAKVLWSWMQGKAVISV